MDKRERDEAIGRVACDTYYEDEGYYDDTVLTPKQKREWNRISLAAVTRAYEIDGVDELVQLAHEAAASLEAEIKNRYGYHMGIHPAQQSRFDCEMSEVVELRAAIARVREARGS